MQSGVLADKASSLDIAKDMALDLAAIEAELNSEAVVRHLQASTGLGDALGFRGTPTFVIGDKVVAGGGRMDELQGLVEAELAKLN
jgi:protein-disulfide isomerase